MVELLLIGFRASMLWRRASDGELQSASQRAALLLMMESLHDPKNAKLP